MISDMPISYGSMTFAAELDLILRASGPLIYITSLEDERLEATI